MAALTGVISAGTDAAPFTAGNLDSSRLSPVFNRNFLKHAQEKLVLAEVAEQFDLPRQAGAQTMRFFRRGVANVENVAALTEGTPTTVFTHATLENVEVSLLQYGAATKITDTRSETDLIKQLELETARMGEEAALHLDTQIRDTAYDAYEAAAITAASTAGLFIDKNSVTAADRMLTAGDIDKAATMLMENRAPTFAGDCYIAVVSPRQAYDLRRDSTWLNVGTYQAKEMIYKGEIGKIFNVKVIVSTNPKTVTAAIDWNADGDATDAATADIVAEAHTLTFEAAFVLGRECLGTIKLGSNSPLAPSLIINDKADKSDPLNQFMTAGWKAYYASMVLNTSYGVVIRSEQNAL